ncbi:NAD(P)/FAD-dependent oxidoreductase [Methylobacterium sp. sgz302541]|uniref:NAD(P)/FAD-dependent oxidoreductase n=1 Tax=unclassified Methylobacterium TaxID=2615210 RepID=UPI003D34ABE7
MSHHTETLVIGAGPAGLTAAYQLSKQGRDVLVLERDPAQVGGISRTVSHKGYLFDIGGHRFFSKSKAVVDLWDEILPDDFIDRPRLSRIYYKGRYYAYPLKAFEALKNLGLLQSTACVASYLYARARPVKEAKSFHQWVRNQFGERLFSIFFKTYTEKVWGMSCDDISADWAAQRIKGLDLGSAIKDALVRSLGLRRKQKAGEPVIKTLIESFRYPRRGPGMMWEAAAEKIHRNGGRVVLDRSVEGLSYDSGTGIWTVSAVTGGGARETYTARHVISSAPVRELVDAIHPRPISTFNARALRYRDFLTVALIAKAREDFPDNWIYIHDPSVKVGRVQNFRSWSPEMVPDEGFTCLGLEYFCFEGDGLWNASDDELVDLAKREIGKIGLIAAEDVVDACVVRQPKAYPVYDDAYRDNVATVRMELERDFPTLHLVGRNGMHKYNNQDHAMMTAMLTVENIVAGYRRHDVWRVNEDAEYTESGVSGADEALASERLVPRKVA